MKWIRDSGNSSWRDALKSSGEKDEILVRYLLGQLSESEQSRVERRYFNDDDFNEQLEIVEEELIDDYVNGRLTGADSEAFEKYFMQSSAGRERVKIAREWRDFVSRSSRPAKPKSERTRRTRWPIFSVFRNRFMFMPLAAMILLASGLAWMVTENARLRNQLDDVREEVTAQERNAQEMREQVEGERRRSEQLAEELKSQRSRPEVKPEIPPLRSVIASFVLTSGLVRSGGEAGRLLIPPDATEVKLSAVFKSGDYPSYIADLQTVEGRTIWRRRGLKALRRGDDRVMNLTVPARLLRDEDYILILNGIASTGEIKSVSEYSFRVAK